MAPRSHEAHLSGIPSWGFTPHRCEHGPESQINSQAHAPPKVQEKPPLTPLPGCLASCSPPLPALQFPCLQAEVPWGCDGGGDSQNASARKQLKIWPFLETTGGDV